MEEGKNIFEKQVAGMGKTKEGKSPTRLQMHAPASLEIDQMKADFGSAGTRTSPFGTSKAATPIPFLIPLALSPNLFPETDEFVFPIDDKKAAATPVPTAFAWKEPAGAGYVEASTLLVLFQNRCVLVNDAQ